MADICLTVKEVAELKGCTERFVRKQISNSTICAEMAENNKSGSVVVYRIPLTALDKKLQTKYKRQQLAAMQQTINTQEEALSLRFTPVPDYENLTESERRELFFWKGILDEWQKFRTNAEENGNSLAEADATYVALTNNKWAANPPAYAKSLSNSQLHRKRKDLKEKGELSLISKRGKHGNHARKMTPEMVDIFECYYLDDHELSAKQCAFLTHRELLRRYGAENVPEMPKVDMFERVAQNIPLTVRKYFRKRHTEFVGDCAPHITRMYDMQPNDIWVADNHKFDVIVSKDGKQTRVYLTAFMDVKTRKFMGWCVTENPCADATLLALKNGIAKYGAPKMIYCDNGREFLFHDFGGNGFRKSAKLKEGEFKPPTILEDMGIEFKTALPKNARAKGIERAFRGVKDDFSKLHDTYTGGHVLEKPDSLAKALKQGNIPAILDFIKFADAYIEGWYNQQPHRGEGMNGRTPNEAFAEELYEQRIVPPNLLDLMFMRYGKGTMNVSKTLSIKVYGQRLNYFDEGLWRDCCGKEVYVRYDPAKLESIRVFDTDGRFICEAALDTVLGYDANSEEIQTAQRAKRHAIKTVANYKRIEEAEVQKASDAMLDYFIEGQANAQAHKPKPKMVELVRPIASASRKAVSDDYEPLDLYASSQHLLDQQEKRMAV
ncbi:MAG: Mu transposase C-terminal domain-containing protein [Defluviitaleaceae bacterium]|nr:Mu transposase C-terminal domain-containing protein [Defluviitaleaceae bacterium]MCL2273397.1 Mu transposase C-terminal domain-containing protein [Defluviitaleaceae bacterium]